MRLFAFSKLLISNGVRGCHRGLWIACAPMSSNAIESLRVTANGVNFHYEKTGSGKHKVLLLPGALGSSRTDFLPQLEGFDKNNFTLYAFDPRGYGRSIPPERDWPADFLRRDADDAAALMAKLGEKTYSVIGWSDGGNTGMMLAASNPHAVSSLVIFGGNSYVTEQDMKSMRNLEDINNWSERMRKPFIEVYGEEYFRKHWSQYLDAYGRILSDQKGNLCLDDLPKIICPTLILHGKKDPIVPQEQPDYLLKHIKNARYHEYPEGKHNIHLRYADDFNKLVTKFLDGVASRL